MSYTVTVRMPPLVEARTSLCDLLQGRILRAHAAEFLADALELEALRRVPREVIDAEVARAAHAEWCATISEQGRVGGGDRHNRCDAPYRLELSWELLPEAFTCPAE